MKVTKSEANTIRFSESTNIISYPSSSKDASVARITVKGRHPQEKNQWFIEHECDVLFYIIKGEGSVTIENEVCEVQAEDTVIIPKGKEYFIEGNLDYVATTSPAYDPDQNEIVEKEES